MKKYIFKFKGLFVIVCLTQIVLSSMNIVLAFMFQYIIDLASNGNLNKFIIGIIWFLLFCIAMFILDVLLPIIKSIYIKKTLIYMKEDIFFSLLDKDVSNFNENNSSKYISILNNDINMIEQDGLLNIFRIIGYIFSFSLAFFSISYINIRITFAIFITGAMTFIIPQLFNKKLSKRRQVYSTSLENFVVRSKDLLNGFEVIKTFNLFDRVKDLYSDINEKVENNKFIFSIYSSTIDAISSNLGTLIFCVPIVLGGYYVVIGDMTVGTMIALFQLMGSIVNPLTSGVQLWNKLKSLKSIFSKIINLTNIEECHENKETLNKFKNTIEFNNVTFSYDQKTNVLNNISLSMESGKNYAFIGSSGSGKSTLVKLLLRYYNNFEGSISIDGIDLNRINTSDICRNISLIQQNVFMFDGDIKDNISLYQNYTDDEILSVIEKVGLKKLINSMPNGIYEDIGENGCKLSGGEKQRIAIARALLKDTSVMILDESTSALDNENAYNIEKSILEIDDITTIVVTHRLIKNLLLKYDEIFVFRDGNIVERGNFNQLINQKGYFYNLYNISKNSLE